MASINRTQLFTYTTRKLHKYDRHRNITNYPCEILHMDDFTLEKKIYLISNSEKCSKRSGGKISFYLYGNISMLERRLLDLQEHQTYPNCRRQVQQFCSLGGEKETRRYFFNRTSRINYQCLSYLKKKTLKNI